MTYDVLILGGGLSGLNLAQTLYKNNPHLKIGLIEKGQSVKNNPLRLTFVDTLQNFDLLDCARATYKQFGLISYHVSRNVHQFYNEKFATLDEQKAGTKIPTNLP